jgi:Spy/CpxP family protein refolding chaperone
MNIKSMLLIAAASMLLMANASAGDRGPRHERGHSGMGPEVMEYLTRALHQLDLTEEQKTAIHADLQGLKDSMKPLAQELRASRKALHEQITADEYDAEAVAEIAANQGSLTAEMTVIASQTASGVLARLTDEQRAELKTMAEEHHAKRKAHMQRKQQGATDEAAGNN